jgi:hypothetical protein
MDNESDFLLNIPQERFENHLNFSNEDYLQVKFCWPQSFSFLIRCAKGEY